MGKTIDETLDSALKERLRAVVRDEPVTEAELRKLAEEGRACELILGGQLQHAEERVAALSSDPSSRSTSVHRSAMPTSSSRRPSSPARTKSR